MSVSARKGGHFGSDRTPFDVGLGSLASTHLITDSSVRATCGTSAVVVEHNQFVKPENPDKASRSVSVSTV